jgi:hypothetical protein
MRQRLSPQSRFLLRSSLFFAALLALWWFMLLGPLLAWTRFSTDFALNAVPGAPLKTGVSVRPDGVWVIQAPVKVGGVWRNVRVESGRRLPVQLTVGLPLFWAILLASRLRAPSSWIGGTSVLLAIPPAGLLLYATHVVQMYLFPNTPGLARAAIAAADYIMTTVAPYFGPVLLALVVHPALRKAVLEGEVVPLREGGGNPPVESAG